MYQTIIEQCWDAFGHSPRRISLWDKWTLWLMDKPEWLQNNSDDDLRLVFENWGRLIREGAVVWGHVVQANGMLFEPGPHDCPGEMVFLLDQKVVDPDFLLQVARKLQSLKHTTPEDPGLRAVADHLTNEQTRRFGLPVPA
ncbi:MAG: hypothetical protein JSS02_28930, partial [Planctomycetes bacterium]|nr:hypothetical protein [Planctomycetota bacterium]